MDNETKKIMHDNSNSVAAKEMMRGFKDTGKKTGLNPANHNTQTKRYSKLSLSLTKKEKEQIATYNKKKYPRTSISSMIMLILEKEGVFEEEE